MGLKTENTISNYMCQIKALEDFWEKQVSDIDVFLNVVDHIYKKIEDADCRAGEKTTLEFTPVELETLLEAVGCAFEYHHYRMDSEVKSIRIEAAQQIVGARAELPGFNIDSMEPDREPLVYNHKEQRNELVKILGLTTPCIQKRKLLHRHIEHEYRWLIGEILDTDLFYSRVLEGIKKVVDADKIPVSRKEALDILTSFHDYDDVQSCERMLNRRLQIK